MYAVLNLMSETGINISTTTSVLGYCLLPMVLLSSLTLLPTPSYATTYPTLTKSESLRIFAALVSIIWCTNSASVMFVTVLDMSQQRFLVAYPVALLYSAFAMLAVFK